MVPGLSLGHEQIDGQHCSLLAALDECIRQARAGYLSLPAYDQLCAHAEVDFRCEEALLDSAGFSGIEFHRAQHRLLESRIAGLAPAAGQERGPELFEALERLRRRIASHFAVEDRRCFPCLMRRKAED